MIVFKNGRQVLVLLLGTLLLSAAGVAWFRRDLWQDWLSRWPAFAAADRGAEEIADDDDERASDRVRLASPDMARRIGIETAQVTTERHAHRLTANAEAAYDGRRYTEVLARVTGIVHEARVEPSQVVGAGDVLAVLDSATVGNAKTQYRTARATVELAQATYDRLRTLAQQEIVAGKSELEALTALTQAKNNLLDADQKLRNFGFHDDDLKRIAAAQSTTNRIDVVAPIGGHVILWDATIGEAVEPTTPLFILADTETMWLWIDVYESDIASVKIGQPVTFEISGAAAPRFAGTVAAIGTEVDRVTRTTRVRAELANPDGRLRANQFGLAEIEVEPDHEALVVPADAVQRHEGDQEMVFSPDGPQTYLPRQIVTRATDDKQKREVLRGLEAGETVVTTGAFILLSELHKERIAEDVD
ncbi:MAG TPA: efflux RND transporter periplasmic adaptor subunit [Pirellulales bacterium]|nr:efflux RND transporter periplasmic adaptor subunit [Pirellulales bacterium]